MVDGSLAKPDGYCESTQRLASEKLTERGWRGSKTTNWRNSPFPHHSSRTVPRDGVLPGRGDRATIQSIVVYVDRVHGPCHVQTPGLVACIFGRVQDEDGCPVEPHEMVKPGAGHEPSIFSSPSGELWPWDLPWDDGHETLAHDAGAWTAEYVAAGTKAAEDRAVTLGTAPQRCNLDWTVYQTC